MNKAEILEKVNNLKGLDKPMDEQRLNKALTGLRKNQFIYWVKYPDGEREYYVYKGEQNE